MPRARAARGIAMSFEGGLEGTREIREKEGNGRKERNFLLDESLPHNLFSAASEALSLSSKSKLESWNTIVLFDRNF